MFIIFLILSLSAIMTPLIVVYFLNSQWFDVYDELQSWQGSYCIWGFSCGILILIFAINSLFRINKKFVEKLEDWLLFPFGIVVAREDKDGNKKKGKRKRAWPWLIPLVSVAVSIVIGFILNFAFEERFLLQCNDSYDGDADLDHGICYEHGEDVFCCRPKSSHNPQEGTRFLGDLASNILAAWAVVRAIGYFICIYDQGLDVKDKAQSDMQHAMEEDGVIDGATAEKYVRKSSVLEIVNGAIMKRETMEETPSPRRSAGHSAVMTSSVDFDD